jgi:hypothetical protein
MKELNLRKIVSVATLISSIDVTNEYTITL